MNGFIPLGNSYYAFINERNKVVWAHEDEIETNQGLFLPSMWDIEKDNWSQFSEEPHPLFLNDLIVIDQSELFTEEQSKSTSKPKG